MSIKQKVKDQALFLSFLNVGTTPGGWWIGDCQGMKLVLSPPHATRFKRTI